MKINLKELAQNIEALKHTLVLVRSLEMSKVSVKSTEKFQRFLEEIELDLEMGGESIIELDKPRLEAIKERDKFLQFIKKADEP